MGRGGTNKQTYYSCDGMQYGASQSDSHPDCLFISLIDSKIVFFLPLVFSLKNIGTQGQ